MPDKPLPTISPRTVSPPAISPPAITTEERLLLQRWCALGIASRAQRSAADSPAGLDAVSRAAGSPGLSRAKQLQLDRWLGERGAQTAVLFRWSKNFPAILREIIDPPAVLFARGSISALARPRVAMVGSRAASHSGAAMARRLAAGLSQAGVLVVSGLAQGIDRAAHEGALSVGQPTLTIPGSGLNNLYPRKHQKLAESIVAAGGLQLSEYAPWVRPYRSNFPARNRLISGLAGGVVVVQAALRSGSLITARLAGEQGREVMAVPGVPGTAVSAGCNQLLREGAALIETVDDVFNALGWRQPETDHLPVPHDGTQGGQANSLGAAEQQLLAAIDSVPLSTEALTQFVGLPPEELAGALLTLELHGLVRATAHGYIRAV